MKFLMKNSLLNPEIKSYIVHNPSNIIYLSSSSDDGCCEHSDNNIEVVEEEKCNNTDINHMCILSNLRKTTIRKKRKAIEEHLKFENEEEHEEHKESHITENS